MPQVFAYGSNLDVDQMSRRCPSASFVSIALLQGRLDFGGYSASWGGAVAAITPSKNRVVPGVVYNISQYDLTCLDMYEGVPFAYIRRTVKVSNLLTSSTCRVHAYMFADWDGYGIPNARYVQKIWRAYQFWGLHRYGHGILSAIRRSLRNAYGKD